MGHRTNVSISNEVFVMATYQGSLHQQYDQQMALVNQLGQISQQSLLGSMGINPYQQPYIRQEIQFETKTGIDHLFRN